ncbi:MAG TPA: hypothetical protein VGE55_10090 [Limnobacter sp.]|uniref:hypothetical protein n=1 Tax=Limnobacter sp. TaxID=2003368 RepID=UPI002ED8C3E7
MRVSLKKSLSVLGLTLIFAMSVADTWAASNTPDLTRIIAIGQTKEVNDYSPAISKSIWVRLHSLPEKTNRCQTETSTPCRLNYWLSAATMDEQPEVALQPLGVLGEVVDIEWLPVKSTTCIDWARLKLTVKPFTKAAMEANPSIPQDSTQLFVEMFTSNQHLRIASSRQAFSSDQPPRQCR